MAFYADKGFPKARITGQYATVTMFAVIGGMDRYACAVEWPLGNDA